MKCQMHDIISMNAFAITQYRARLGLPDKGRTINELVVCINLYLEPLDLFKGLALDYYQPSPEVSIVLMLFANS